MVYCIQSLQSRLLGKEACNALSSFGAGLQGFHLGIVLILDDSLHGLLRIVLSRACKEPTIIEYDGREPKTL